MLRCVRRAQRTCACPARWRPAYQRRHASSAAQPEPEWFQALRTEMLGRELPILSDTPAPTQEGKLENALSGFLPRSWFCARPGPLAADKLPIGHHLIYANPDLPASGLLPDGTDMLHSPGDPFVRRMWAGGSVKVHVDRYFGRDGLRLRNMACVERIKDVQLRGQDDAVKIFVTIERAMINSAGLIDPTKDGFSHNTDRTRRDEVRHEFRKRLLEGTDDTGASLVEQRQLVFMKQRSEHEMEAIRAGQMAPVKYLPSPGQPDFSHPLTPTPTLLFRYSALSYNAHAIHLDREYARTVEGHRNLLVHGPLQLLLILKLVTNHIESLPGPPRTIQSIEYRNVAPLYCSEQLRLCGRKHEAEETGSEGDVYDVWIEGPTGGVAFRGKVRTVLKPQKDPAQLAVGPHPSAAIAELTRLQAAMLSDQTKRRPGATFIRPVLEKSRFDGASKRPYSDAAWHSSTNSQILAKRIAEVMGSLEAPDSESAAFHPSAMDSPRSPSPRENQPLWSLPLRSPTGRPLIRRHDHYSSVSTKIASSSIAIARKEAYQGSSSLIRVHIGKSRRAAKTKGSEPVTLDPMSTVRKTSDKNTEEAATQPKVPAAVSLVRMIGVPRPPGATWKAYVPSNRPRITKYRAPPSQATGEIAVSDDHPVVRKYSQPAIRRYILQYPQTIRRKKSNPSFKIRTVSTEVGPSPLARSIRVRRLFSPRWSTERVRLSSNRRSKTSRIIRNRRVLRRLGTGRLIRTIPSPPQPKPNQRLRIRHHSATISRSEAVPKTALSTSTKPRATKSLRTDAQIRDLWGGELPDPSTMTRAEKRRFRALSRGYPTIRTGDSSNSNSASDKDTLLPKGRGRGRAEQSLTQRLLALKRLSDPPSPPKDRGRAPHPLARRLLALKRLSDPLSPPTPRSRIPPNELRLTPPESKIDLEWESPVRTYTTTNTHSASGAYLEGSHFARRGVRKLEQYRVRKVEDSLETSRREKRLGDGFGGWRKDLEGWVWEGR